ncbi:permease-like cell division protein FtsX [Streptococcus fryi]
MISRFFRHLWNSIKNLKRNGWMTFASITSVSITLILVGIIASVIFNTERIATGIENNIRINTYLLVDSTDHLETIVNAQGQTVENGDYHKVYNQITAIEGVESVTFSSKDEELKKLIAVMGDDWHVFDGDSNPLYNVYIVNTKTPDQVKPVAKQIKKITGVDFVEYGGTDTEKVFKIAGVVRLWGFVGMGVFLFIAILLISNTVRITIMSRSREIQIMRLVGAKNSYIKGPFFLEGAWVGMLGAIMPSILLYYGYQTVYLQSNPALVRQGLSMYSPYPHIFYLIGILFVIGILIGSFGSTLSMRRYLKA